MSSLQSEACPLLTTQEPTQAVGTKQGRAGTEDNHNCHSTCGLLPALHAGLFLVRKGSCSIFNRDSTFYCCQKKKSV